MMPLRYENHHQWLQRLFSGNISREGPGRKPIGQIPTRLVAKEEMIDDMHATARSSLWRRGMRLPRHLPKYGQVIELVRPRCVVLRSSLQSPDCAEMGS